MPKKKIEEIVKKLALPIIDKYKFELVDIEFKKEGPHWYLRLFIDKPGGITINDCELVSEDLSKILDEVDPIEQSYILEVSSPGLDRPLKTMEDYKKFKDYEVEIKLFAPYNGHKNFIGKLNGLVDNKVSIQDENNKTIEIPLNIISSVRLHEQF
ncbi:ribosome maturation factor RimP [Garciella nitratireducens]|uniref:Ribosome maturation factor RimP n=1 Tax=Garciella nitratireducens DSM 15102 TaxID=1121911 RepID=A0A1T4JWQ6_9FIRM|nr:ribosome maturation factor RimP [Garciella nitratireducens]RBP41165.1 ribosome maturation factor RimP [Garciella nitratireducens]SJZ34579.1 ribosome maturation factor RimP [Garciella nitratireducens DSM 15102]